MLFSILPKELLWDIIIEWLSCLKDFSSLDRAVTNKEIRCCLFTVNVPARKLEFKEAVQIGSNKKLIEFVKWKKHRSVEIENMCLNKYDAPCNRLPHFGCYFSQLRDLKIVNWELQLQDIFYCNLPHLEKLILNNCTIFIQELAAEYISTTNLKELIFGNIILTDGKALLNAAVSPNHYAKFCLWIANSCPQLQTLNLKNCYVTPQDVIPMIQTLSALKYLNYCAADLRTRLQNVPHTPSPLAAEREQQGMMTTLPSIDTLILTSKVSSSSGYLIWHHMMNIAFECCIHQALDEININIAEFVEVVRNRLLQHIQQEWKNVRYLTLRWGTASIVPYLTACVETCTQLYQLIFHGSSWEETVMPTILLENRLLSLYCLSFQSIPISNESMELLCTSSLAQQLTVLKLIDITSLSLETYHLITFSFPKLQIFELQVIPVLDAVAANEMKKQANHLAVVQWLDVLFNSDQCIFAQTIQSLTIKLSLKNENKMYCDLNEVEHQSFGDMLFTAHMIPHWQFAFPVLHMLFSVFHFHVFFFLFYPST